MQNQRSTIAKDACNNFELYFELIIVFVSNTQIFVQLDLSKKNRCFRYRATGGVSWQTISKESCLFFLRMSACL